MRHQAGSHRGHVALGFIAFGILIGAAGLLQASNPSPLSASCAFVAGYGALTFGYTTTRRLARRVRAISLELGQAAGQIAEASAQLASANQMMAQGIAAQSESVSGVAGSSELMASIMRQTAESSSSAGALMNKADQLAAQVTVDLEAMVVSIREGNAASTRIAGVTKVVDELAFQTNILALNAAVEAARAGESGAGFAVVAGEVRNLAQRSAAAARDIAELVEQSSRKSTEGSAKLDQVADAMRTLIKHTAGIKVLMDEMTTSNSELVQGTNQISEEMRQLDTTVQNAAATSEETAATGEEMSAQSAAMQSLVSSLQAVSG